MLSLYFLETRQWRRWEARGEQCRQGLAQQQITAQNPGTILKDVQTFLEFVGLQGIATKSGTATVPAGRLSELNAKISHPLTLELKRALLRDYPNLAGIFVLLRVMELLELNGNRLRPCPAALDCWFGLNPTEQYFALLEALLFHVQTSMVGADARREEPQAFRQVAVFLGQLSEKWRNFDNYESSYNLGPQGELPRSIMFLLHQMGLIEVRSVEAAARESRSGGGKGWLVGAAKLTPWGTAVTWALLEFLRGQRPELYCEDEPAATATAQPGFDFGEQTENEDSGQPGDGGASESAEAHDSEADLQNECSEDTDEGAGVEPGFGTLHSLFQPYFPEWQKLYARPGHPPSAGTHIFKVTIGGWRGRSGVWRRLAAPPDVSLDSLADAILGAFNFDRDHLYDFRYRDRRGKHRVYYHPECDEGPWTTGITVGESNLAVKDAMVFTFDYGDHWEFEARLERIESGASQLSQPEVIESAGKAPEQYPSFE